MLAVLPILLLAAASLQTPTKFTATRDLRIGSVDDPEYTLTWMQSIKVGKDGSIYSLHYPEKLVRQFDATGKLIRKFGRAGKGPGEFSNPAWMSWRGDTLYVYDSVDRRYSMFAPDGRFLVSVTVPPRSAGADRAPSPGFLLADGTLTGSMSLNERRDAMGGLSVGEIMMLRLDREGHVLDTLLTLPAKNRTMVISDDQDPPRWRSFTRQAFADDPFSVVAADGASYYLIERPMADNARRAFFTIKRFSFDGKQISARRYSYVPQPVTDAQIDSIVNGHVKSLTTARDGQPARMTEAQARAAVLRALYRPDFHPPIQEAVAGRDGTLWLKREDLRKNMVQWMIIGASGDMIGVVDLPRRLRGLEADRTQILGEEQDELDVPYIVRYRVTAGR